MMRSGRSRAQLPAVLVVLAVHLALLGLLVDSSTMRATRDRRDAPVARIALRLIAAPAPPGARPPLNAASPARSRPPKPARAVASPGRLSAAPRPPDATAITDPQRETAVRPGPAASAAGTDSAAPPLLDTEATRRAIRASARAASLGDQLARAREAPDRAGAQERLAKGVQAAGKGDCLKGDYAGGGMGLLSLPFLAAAATSGDCAK